MQTTTMVFCCVLWSASHAEYDTTDLQREEWLPAKTDKAPDAQLMNTPTGGSEAGDGIMLKQMLSGRDIAKPLRKPYGKPDEAQMFEFAKKMKNFQYFVGDNITGQVAVVDGAWDPVGLEEEAHRLGLTIVAYIATHYHWDHIGDKERGILGLKYFVDREDFPVRAGSSAQPVGLPAYIHSAEAEAAISKCDIVRRERISPVENNTIVWIGDAVRLRFIHTPGHSKGGVSIVIGTKRGGHPVADKLMANDDNVVEKEVLTGDTLFPGSCGRIDLPESDKGEMYKTLQNVLRGLPGTMVVWPGHGYAGGSTTIGRERRTGLLRLTSKAQWDRQMGR